ncbi:hypothetical protein DRO69_14465 [Candidatus Bathyarchaeota archaeon]|nr:MAG: hypothetical protein DRO69_14465 [Candidatus Bathyarchaeota archaeon]
MKPLKNPRLLLAVFLLAIIATPLIPHINASTLTITISTDEPYYLISESITIYGNLTYNGSPIQDWPVALEVQDPNNTPVVTRTLQTDTNGAYNLTFKLPAKAKLGTYTAYASSSYKGETASNNTTFEFIALVQNINTHLGYMTIQAAIDAPETLNGHTILASAGTYYEHVIISKSLTLIGENAKNTIIDGNGDGSVVYIYHNNVTVKGFTVQNGFEGIRLTFSNNSIIMNVVAFNNTEWGIVFYRSYHNTIENCYVLNNRHGLHLDFSNDNVLRNITALNNSYVGIKLYEFSSNNIINNCNSSYNSHGIILNTHTYNNIVKNNYVSCNEIGFELMDSPYNNTISENIVTSNNQAIYIINSRDNLIYHNSFIDNAFQATVSNSTNIWDYGYPSGGNYWSDYTGIDMYSGPYQNETGSDGILDDPYIIDANNTDKYPLSKPYPWGLHDIGVTSLTTSKTVVGQGYNLTISTMMFNYGNSTENFNLTVYANATIIYETTVNLTSRNSTTITLAWNTTSLTKGYYTIRVYAEPVPGETDTTDNTFVYGLITVTIPGDVDGDFDVDIYDVVKITSIYGSTRSDPEFNPNSDLDDDGEITIYDVVRCTSHYGDVDP